MGDERRRQKKLEKKRRQREEKKHALRMREAERLASFAAALDDDAPTFATNVTGRPWPLEASSWPIIRAYVPPRDVWRATGLGTCGVVRQQPDGRCAIAFFGIELHGQGLQTAFGKADMTLDEVEALLAETREHIPPFEDGSADLATAFAWGARALAASNGASFSEEVDPFFDLLPRPSGLPRDWIRKLTGPDGLTPAELVRIAEGCPDDDDLPEGKEVVILTEATFTLDDAEKAKAALRGARPDFESDDGEEFTWSREYPRSRWSPLRLLGGRQVLGSVTLENGKLVAEAKTLSMTAKLIDRLRGLLGDGLRLEGTKWTPASELLRTKSVEGRVTRQGR